MKGGLKIINMNSNMINTLNKIYEMTDELGGDALLITDPYNMRYISGFRGGEGVLYISRSQKVLVTDSRYTEAASKESDFEIIEENREHKRSQILKECAAKDRAEKMIYEDESMKCSEFHRFRDALPEIREWIPAGGRTDALRRIKTGEEIELLAKAEAIGDAAFSDLLGVIRPGMTELKAAAELEYLMKKHGARGFSFDTIMASGEHSSMPHAIPSEREFRDGDFVTMDFGCIYEGYCSDMTRTIAIGHVTEEQRKIYNTVLKAQLAALEAVRPGIKGSEADKVARDIISEAGYGDCFGHSLGHSVGLFIHEEPRLAPGAATILQPGMIETVEPGIYVPGFCGVRIEDMVVITEDGCRNLASSPKELIIL